MSDMREAFEAAMRKLHPEWTFTADPEFGYHNERTRCALEGFQAAWAARQPREGFVEVPVTLGYELDGVIADWRNGQLDDVCMETILRVRKAFAARPKGEAQ